MSSTSVIALSSSLGALAVLLGGYVVASTILHYFPRSKTQYGRKIRVNKRFYLISHRGGAGENIENTLTAFDHSLKLGFDILELDCHLTRDGQVVVCHDNDLYRLTGQKKVINETSYNELPRLLNDLIKERSHAEGTIARSISTSLITNENVQDHYEIRNGENSCKIPLLEDIFERYPNTPINLDIKVDDDELIQKVYDLIRKYNREDLMIWGSFNDVVKNKCLKLNPNIPIISSKPDCFKMILSAFLGYLPFMTLRSSYFEVLLPHFVLRKYGDALPFSFKLVLYILKYGFLRKSLVKHLQKRGITVFLWVLDTEEEFKIALDLGVDGIMTDYPTKLVNYLKNSPEYSYLLD